ncbi:sulfotransferase domain-containing protein [Marinovum sp. 2_MG-2023]|uniref:sulfotransferase domain-containing protein n=1 Tax=unclassified Marinovum TaxID=2647166 RepID=UPI0026E11412|nr:MULTISPECIES: sulfotransferase domain-containing protein [unclassified Marinovum]MDO6732734.1 sulfotransferase domain-containing protein [Marinovum sp. 2_MG-2023]MDO6782008.1 sulfotransferase domain-containing protein [Marinovum sp. 1_MG-2023]
MQKKLIIHIGHYKTGTTALQVFLSQHLRFLANRGISYPDLMMHNAKHSAFAFSILAAAGVTGRLMHDYPAESPPHEMWGELMRVIDAGTSPTTLISSEEFMRIGQFPAAVDILREVLSNRPEGLDIQIIAYLRDPQAHVQSWYNQLIKMNLPVSDLEHATCGTIEDIHYDYRRALEPWINIVGKENVILRPYVNNRKDPAALHRDFFDVLGIPLPDKLVRAGADPNPRLDDRVSELLRLMQNMGFPRASINAVRSQAMSYLETQDAKRSIEEKSIEDIREQSLEGLGWLSEQASDALPVAEFSKHLPMGVSQDVVDRNMLLGFVFSEFIQLRQRVQNFGIPDVITRVEALEAKIAEMTEVKSDS